MTKTPASSQYMGVSESDRPPGTAGLEAFDEVYEREFDYVCRNLGRLGVPAADLHDAVHDVFFVLYQRWTEIDPTRSVRPWLFGVARRIASAIRSKRRETLADVDAPVPTDPLVAQRDLVWRAMDALDDDRRIVISSTTSRATPARRSPSSSKSRPIRFTRAFVSRVRISSLPFADWRRSDA